MKPIWSGVERLLREASVAGVRAHQLGPLAAQMFRAAGDPVPPELVEEERVTVYALLSVEPLLERIRSAASGPLLVFKGPEVGLRYPGRGRWFGDLDLLVPDAAAVHRELQASGFVEVGDPALYVDIHHLRPLQWRSLPLVVEVHTEPKWPERLRPPRVEEIVEAAVPSQLGIDGISAPDPVHHTLILAAHGWAHEPLRRLRDLVDVVVLAGECEASEVERTARAWHLTRLWHTTDAAARALFAEETSSTVPLRTWARHLPEVRERTVAENHLQAWFANYWALPPHEALRSHAAAIGHDLTPRGGESWRRKLARAGAAMGAARAPLSDHHRALDEADRSGLAASPENAEDAE
jgi:hypothetical protein